MNKRKKSKVSLIVLLVVFVYFAYTIIDQESLFAKKGAERDAVLQQLDGEQKEKKSLEEQQKELTSDENIEKIAREKFGYVKSGEKVFVDVNR